MSGGAIATVSHSDGELDLVLHSPTVEAGSTVRVDVHAEESVEVELLVVERRHGRRTINKSRVLAATTWRPGMGSVQLSVPADAVPAHAGETISWDHELRVVRQRLGPDQRQGAVVDIVQSTPRGVRRPGSSPLQRDARSGAAGTAPSRTWPVYLVVASVCAIAAALVDGPEAQITLGLLALGFGVVGTFMGRADRLHRRYSLPGVSPIVADDVVRVGGHLRVGFEGHASGRDLEVGVVCETYRWAQGDGERFAETAAVHATYKPCTGVAAAFALPAGAPPSYPGEEVAAHWWVVVRDRSLSGAKQRMSTNWKLIHVDP